MARLRGHRALDYEQPLFVRRGALTLSGVEYKLGDELPWRAIGLLPRKVHQLWMGRRIGHERPDERNGAEGPHPMIPPPAPSAEHPPSHPEARTGGEADLSDDELERLTAPGSCAAFTVTPGPRVTVETPAQQRKRKR